MAAAYPYHHHHHHLAFEEETSSPILLYPSAHHSSFTKQYQTTTTTTRYVSKREQARSRQRHSPNWISGGPRVQVIFMGPSPTSCGTGVFLPQRPGQNLHLQPNTKPSPPGADMNRFRDVKAGGYQEESGSSNNNNNKKGKGGSNFSLQTRNKSTSPGIFLPKEWTY